MKPTLYRTEVLIDAPAERVWAVLVDLDRYPEWNPFTVRVDSTLQPGSVVDLHVKLRGKVRVQREYLRERVELQRLAWGMAPLGGIFVSGERVQTLEAVSAGQTRYLSEDRIGGLLRPVVDRLFGPDIRAGFEAMGAALKAYVETPGP